MLGDPNGGPASYAIKNGDSNVNTFRFLQEPREKKNGVTANGRKEMPKKLTKKNYDGLDIPDIPTVE